MRAYSSMPSNEFIEQLRDAAIRAKAAPAVIDQIDSLGSVQELESQLDKEREALTDMESDRDDLRDELESLTQYVLDALDDIAPVRSALKTAADALERHDARDWQAIKAALAKRA